MEEGSKKVGRQGRKSMHHRTHTHPDAFDGHMREQRNVDGVCVWHIALSRPPPLFLPSYRHGCIRIRVLIFHPVCNASRGRESGRKREGDF
jgi:hypothetical protein